MKRMVWLLCGIAVFVSPHTLMAQRRGGHGGGAGAARGPSGVPNNNDLKDFNRALALQATPDQVQQFHQLSQSVQAVRKSAQDLILVAGNAGGPQVSQQLSQHADPLTGAVQEAQTENEKFLKSFSTAQKSGLKTSTKKLEKTNSEITKQSKALAQELNHAGTRGKPIVSAAGKLEKVLSDFQTEQRSVGDAMGIADEKAPSDQSANAVVK